MGDKMDKLLKKIEEKIVMILLVTVYFFTLILLVFLSSHPMFSQLTAYNLNPIVINGIITQLQLLILVFLVLYFNNKKGYSIALLLNAINFILMLFSLFKRNSDGVIAGIVTALGIFLILTVINNCLVEGERRKKQLYQLAYFDSVTGITNRNVIIHKVRKLTSNLSKNKGKFALVFLDIDNFTAVNDTAGHLVGDLLLKKIAERIKEKIHKEDLFGRTDGDEFAIIIQRDLSKEEILEYLNEIRRELTDVFFIEDKEFLLTASFGVALYPEDGPTASDILKHADISMQHAKKNGKNSISFFSNDIKEKLLTRMKLENELKKAISNKELYLVYQPQYYSYKNEIRGFEVLLRWNSKELGPISPSVFIPIAEENNSIIEIGHWVLNEAMRQFKNNILKYNDNFKLSINISSVQLTDNMFISKVERALKENDFNPKNLEFEITESVFISSEKCAERVINYFKNLGITIALDDFGTGYSALSFLQYNHMNILKIDKAFVDKILITDPNKSLVELIISMAHKLGMEVVAEGVEEKKQVEYLMKHNCDYFQGYLFARPLAIDSVLDLLNDMHRGRQDIKYLYEYNLE